MTYDPHRFTVHTCRHSLRLEVLRWMDTHCFYAFCVAAVLVIVALVPS